MEIREYQAKWDRLATDDPLWAILAVRGKERRWDPEEFFWTGIAEIDGFLRKLADRSVPLASSSALDFGCGVGRLTQALAGRFDRVVGVDISPVMIDHARRFNRFADRCEYRVNASSDLREFADASFDLVFSRLVLMHVPPRLTRGYLREFLRVLRPGGILIFHLPSGPVNRWMRLFPQAALDWSFNRGRALWRWVTRSRADWWEMHWLTQPRVEVAVNKAGGRLLFVTEDEPIDGRLATLDYFVTRAIAN